MSAKQNIAHSGLSNRDLGAFVFSFVFVCQASFSSTSVSYVQGDNKFT